MTCAVPRAISIHAYSPPLWRLGQYSVDAEGRLHRQSVSYADELRPPWRRGGMTDVLVIGGGVMGLFTAYRASEMGARVTVLERGRIGDPMTASYGRTRSFRSRLPGRRVRPLRPRGDPPVGRVRGRDGRHARWSAAAA